MHVQLNALDDEINVHARTGDGAVFVTLAATGLVTKHDSVSIQHADAEYLAGVFEQAAEQLRAVHVVAEASAA